jgi:hypothetical protein
MEDTGGFATIGIISTRFETRSKPPGNGVCSVPEAPAGLSLARRRGFLLLRFTAASLLSFGNECLVQAGLVWFQGFIPGVCTTPNVQHLQSADASADRAGSALWRQWADKTLATTNNCDSSAAMV